MPEVVDILDDDSNDGGVTISLLGDDSEDDEVEVVEKRTVYHKSSQEKHHRHFQRIRNQMNEKKRRQQANAKIADVFLNSDGDYDNVHDDDNSVEIVEQSPSTPPPIGTKTTDQTNSKQTVPSTTTTSPSTDADVQTSPSSHGSNTAVSTNIRNRTPKMNSIKKKRKRPATKIPLPGTCKHSKYPSPRAPRPSLPATAQATTTATTTPATRQATAQAKETISAQTDAPATAPATAPSTKLASAPAAEPATAIATAPVTVQATVTPTVPITAPEQPDPKPNNIDNQQQTMESVRKEHTNETETTTSKLQSVPSTNAFKTSSTQISDPPSNSNADSLSPSPKSSDKEKTFEKPTESKNSTGPSQPLLSREMQSESNDQSTESKTSDGRQGQNGKSKPHPVVQDAKKQSSDTLGEEVVYVASGDAPSGTNTGNNALRMSRDRQYAIFLDRTLNRDENDRTQESVSTKPKSPIPEVIDLIEDDSNITDKAPSPSKEDTEKTKKTTEQEKEQDKLKKRRRLGSMSFKSAPFLQHKRQLLDASQLTSEERKEEQKKDMQKYLCLLSAESSSEESDSSPWMEAIRSKSHGSNLVNKSVPKNTRGSNRSSGNDSRKSTMTSSSEPQPFDFTGKEISTKASRRRSDERESRQVSIETDDIETNGATSQQCQEISQSISTENTKATMPAEQRKPPPPLGDPEVVEQTIIDIDQKIHLRDKVKTQNILRNALLQHTTRTQRSPSNRPVFTRVPAISTKVTEKKNHNGLKLTTDGHTTIVNSSLTVLTTINDSKVEEATNLKRVHDNAQSLSLMPYEYKRMQGQCTEILNALPFDQRYHPQVHELVSEKLYTAPRKSKNKLEMPTGFKYAPNRESPVETTDASTKSTENNDDYVSIMNSFRDFCVQCKSFDCQFHITNYPDAGTQACVAIQYDKRALQRQSRIPFQLDHNDPYSYLIPTTEGTYALFNGGNFDVFDKPPSVKVIKSSGSQMTINFKNGNTACPFCKFNCRNQEKLYKHLGRYHQDTFYCREVESTYEVTARTKEKETMTPQREYFHSRSLIPIQNGHYDRDSDDESDYSWYDEYRQETMDELTDVSDKEKKIQTLWNRYIGCSPVIIPDKHIPKRCFLWIWKHYAEMKDIEWELYQLLITFWERRILNVTHIEKLIHLLHIKRNVKDQHEETLTPRQRVIFSRLHLIITSLGGDAKMRLVNALRINTKGNVRILKTPMLPQHLWPKWSKNRTITTAMRMRSEDIARPFFFPCYHTGRCSARNGCTCIEHDYVCTKHCIWGEFGDNFFPGCNCKGDCSEAKYCPCRDAGRECDPDVCGCAASTDGCLKSCGCSNMDVSLAKKASLFVGKSEIEDAGLGLFTKYALKKGDYIDEVGTQNFCRTNFCVSLYSYLTESFNPVALISILENSSKANTSLGEAKSTILIILTTT